VAPSGSREPRQAFTAWRRGQQRLAIFKSKALDTQDKFSFTFTTPGTYAYFCSLHPHMSTHLNVAARP
jgi:plastocyanin